MYAWVWGEDCGTISPPDLSAWLKQPGTLNDSNVKAVFVPNKYNGHTPVDSRLVLKCCATAMVNTAQVNSLLGFLVRQGVLGLALYEIGNRDLSVRVAAYDALGSFLQSCANKGQMSATLEQIKLLLLIVRNSVDKPFERLPPLWASTLANFSLVMENPGHSAFGEKMFSN